LDLTRNDSYNRVMPEGPSTEAPTPAAATTAGAAESTVSDGQSSPEPTEGSPRRPVFGVDNVTFLDRAIHPFGHARDRARRDLSATSRKGNPRPKSGYR